MKTIKLLTIGNSFSNNALTWLAQIAESTGTLRFEIGRANIGGCSLEKHWNLAQYTAKHPDYKTYNLRENQESRPLMMNLQDALSAEEWDFVTLQQVSWRSWRRESFEPWLGSLLSMVRNKVPGAEILLHQTWAYRTDSPFYPENGLTQPRMHQRIRENFLHFATAYECGILPSGEAVDSFRQLPGRSFVWPDPAFGYAEAEAPALPLQENSLAVGWHWRITATENGKPLIALDANHLNAKGCYLCGAVWFEKLTGLSIYDSHFRPEEISEEDFAILRRVAHKTVSPADSD